MALEFTLTRIRHSSRQIAIPRIGSSGWIALCDGSKNNYGSIGTPATGDESQRLLAVGLYWKGEIPPGIKKVFVP
jgi:hypothetical protein